MRIILQRKKRQGELLLGKLSINRIVICDTLENIHGALPPGTYPIVRHWCKQLERKVPLLITPDTTFMEQKCKYCMQMQEVSNNRANPCFCPQIKVGNGVHNIHDGRILVGKQLVPQCLVQTQSMFDRLCERIRKQRARGRRVVLEIM